jgi:hypothetical protein
MATGLLAHSICSHSSAAPWCTFREPSGGGVRSQCQVVTNFSELAQFPPSVLRRPALFTDQLQLAVAAYLARSAVDYCWPLILNT